MTTHKLLFGKAQKMKKIADEAVDLIVTSPPYPMIEMWDEILFKQNKRIETAFKKEQFTRCFELMHLEMDKVWQECYRVLKPGGIACINIGDATRTLAGNFQLFSNHARMIEGCLSVGFQNLPNIIWRKQTNAPNKFMGSGMMPPGAYVTLEHEFILLFRKGEKRAFKKSEEKKKRAASSYFWEERNQWFSDLWEVKGTTQKLFDKATRKRSAAYPFEIPYRLINMFSVQEDTVLDPFLGTGTTTLAAICCQRNSLGYEIDKNLRQTIEQNLLGKEEILKDLVKARIKAHKDFVKKRKKLKGKEAFKYTNDFYDVPVVTRQEVKMQIPLVDKITLTKFGLSANYT